MHIKPRHMTWIVFALSAAQPAAVAVHQNNPLQALGKGHRVSAYSRSSYLARTSWLFATLILVANDPCYEQIIGR